MSELFKVDIHGSCVSRDIFRNQDIFKVVTYIGRNSIMSTSYPAITKGYQDTLDANSNWEKRMIDTDFKKNIFEQFRTSKSDFLVIDLIDELFNLVKITNENGDESAVTYSQVLRRSSYIEGKEQSEIDIIDTFDIDNKKILDVIENYAKEILSIYEPHQIIINEVYPAEMYNNKLGGVSEFDGRRLEGVKRNKQKLKIWYSLLENELEGCHILKMSPGIVCDELHQWGLASTHFEKRFYEECLYKITNIAKSITDNNDEYNEICKRYRYVEDNAEKRDEKYSFKANKLLNKQIVVWGAQQYFVQNIEKIDSRVKIKALFPEGQYDKKLEEEYKIITDLEKLLEMDDVFVLIARGRAEDISRIVQILISNNIEYDHIEFFTHQSINVRYLKALKHYDYTDLDGNRFIIAENVSDKVCIERNYAKNGYVEIGFNRIQTRLKLIVLGENAYIKIGKDGSFVDVIITVNTNGIVKIGSECMFSHSISLNQSDQHHIFDMFTHKRINYPKAIVIGNHVWAGREVELCGGAHIGNNCVIGARAITSSSFKDNVILAGCPARVVRENIIWSRDLLTLYNWDVFEECNEQGALKYLR